jgi:hypothetical protein
MRLVSLCWDSGQIERKELIDQTAIIPPLSTCRPKARPYDRTPGRDSSHEENNDAKRGGKLSVYMAATIDRSRSEQSLNRPLLSLKTDGRVLTEIYCGTYVL